MNTVDTFALTMTPWLTMTHSLSFTPDLPPSAACNCPRSAGQSILMHSVSTIFLLNHNDEVRMDM